MKRLQPEAIFYEIPEEYYVAVSNDGEKQLYKHTNHKHISFFADEVGSLCIVDMDTCLQQSVIANKKITL